MGRDEQGKRGREGRIEVSSTSSRIPPSSLPLLCGAAVGGVVTGAALPPSSTLPPSLEVRALTRDTHSWLRSPHTAGLPFKRENKTTQPHN